MTEEKKHPLTLYISPQALEAAKQLSARHGMDYKTYLAQSIEQSTKFFTTIKNQKK